MKRLSLIVSVLDSHEVVRRQLLHLNRILSADCELILIDDGSNVALRPTCDLVPKAFSFVFHATNDPRPWTQPKARNIGASLASADKLLFFDIDHIVTSEVLHAGLDYAGDKLHWLRRPGVLNEHGSIETGRQHLLNYGLVGDEVSVHANSFLIRRYLSSILAIWRSCQNFSG